MAHDDFARYCLELLAGLGPCRAKRMFGGHGIYLDDLMFGLVAGDKLYLKADAQTRPRWEAAGSEPFTYSGRGKPIEMSYWLAPDDAMESPELMRPWARLALEAALRARAAKPVAKPARKAATPAVAKKRSTTGGRAR